MLFRRFQSLTEGVIPAIPESNTVRENTVVPEVSNVSDTTTFSENTTPVTTRVRESCKDGPVRLRSATSAFRGCNT